MASLESAPSLSDVSAATAASHTALLVMVRQVESASSQVSPPEARILNHIVAVGAVVVGAPDGAADGTAVGFDGAVEVGSCDGTKVEGIRVGAEDGTSVGAAVVGSRVGADEEPAAAH